MGGADGLSRNPNERGPTSPWSARCSLRGLEEHHRISRLDRGPQRQRCDQLRASSEKPSAQSPSPLRETEGGEGGCSRNVSPGPKPQPGNSRSECASGHSERSEEISAASRRNAESFAALRMMLMNNPGRGPIVPCNDFRPKLAFLALLHINRPPPSKSRSEAHASRVLAGFSRLRQPRLIHPSA